MLLLGSALGHVWLRLAATETAYRLQAMGQAVDKLEQERRELRLEVAAAEAPATLAAAGRALGLGPPKWGAEVRLP
jgi:hypothetical protein